MKIFFLTVIVAHGLIHFLGFVKAYNLADVRQLTQSISKSAGLMWLTAGMLFFLAALLYLLAPEYWWIVGVPAVVLSQTLIFLSWKDAKFGTIATFIVLIPLIIAIANILPGSFRNIYREEAEKEISRLAARSELGTPPFVTDDDVARLPIPVQKYLRYAGAVGKPRVQDFRARFTGQIRRSMESGWMDFTSEQYNFFDDPTRIFLIESNLYGIPFEGLHLYEGAGATMQISIASLFQIVDAEGDTMTRSETVTLFNDMCVMAPATLIDSSIRWETIDSLTAKATYSNRGYTISATLFFNSEGALVDFSSDDRFMSADGITYKNYRWTTPMKDYEEFEGRRLPTEAELIWHMPEGEYVYGKFKLKQMEYNCKEFK